MHLSVDDFRSAKSIVKSTNIPIWHDVKKNYEPLETLIGELNQGCGFGELAMNMDGKD